MDKKNKIYCYTGLNRPVYLLGVPTILLITEGVGFIYALVFFGFLVGGIALCGIIFLHLFIRKLYKDDAHWVRHLIYRFNIPDRKMNIDSVAYVPERNPHED